MGKNDDTEEVRYFDEEGFKILDMTSKCLEIKKPKTKKGNRKSTVSAMVPSTAPPSESDKKDKKHGDTTARDLIIPFKLDMNQPPPPPSVPITTAYEWWLRKGAAMFPHLAATIPISTGPTATTTGLSAAGSRQTPAPPVPEEASRSAPSVVARQMVVHPKTHRYSANRPQQHHKAKKETGR